MVPGSEASFPPLTSLRFSLHVVTMLGALSVARMFTRLHVPLPVTGLFRVASKALHVVGLC